MLSSKFMWKYFGAFCKFSALMLLCCVCLHMICAKPGGAADRGDVLLGAELLMVFYLENKCPWVLSHSAKQLSVFGNPVGNPEASAGVAAAAGCVERALAMPAP